MTGADVARLLPAWYKRLKFETELAELATTKAMMATLNNLLKAMSSSKSDESQISLAGLAALGFKIS